MEISRDFAALLVAVVSIGIGAYGIVKGEIAFGGEGSDSDRLLMGSRARIVSAGLVIAGLALLTGSSWGYLLLLAALLLPRLLGRNQS
jgi:hypothetical protein